MLIESIKKSEDEVTVFIDDNRNNVEAAVMYGFDIGIVYNNATELRFILENLEILPQQHSIALATA